VLACPEIDAGVAVDLRRQRERLDPFALASTIEQRLERIFTLATTHPTASSPSAAAVPRPVRKRFSIKPSPHLAAKVSRPVTSATAR